MSFLTGHQFCEIFDSIFAFGNHGSTEASDCLLFEAFGIQFLTNNATDGWLGDLGSSYHIFLACWVVLFDEDLDSSDDRGISSFWLLPLLEHFSCGDSAFFTRAMVLF